MNFSLTPEQQAIQALAREVAEAEAIDTIAKLGFAHPMGRSRWRI